MLESGIVFNLSRYSLEYFQMSRLLMLIAIAVVIYLLIKSYRKKMPQQDNKIAEDMVRCAHCGVHLPKGESIQAEEQFFCSASHRDAYRKKTM